VIYLGEGRLTKKLIRQKVEFSGPKIDIARTHINEYISMPQLNIPQSAG